MNDCKIKKYIQILKALYLEAPTELNICITLIYSKISLEIRPF